MRRLKLLIAEDHPLMIEAIQLALSRSADFEIVGVAESGSDVVAAALKLQPDVVLLDLRMPGMDGFQVLQALRRSGATSKTVILSASEDADIVGHALHAGAHAFITKRIDPNDLPAALRQAVDQTLFQPSGSNPLVEDDASGVTSLTERELAVLTCVAKGLSNKEIAQQLSYAEQTVKLELTRVYRKLGVSSRTEAMAVAFRLGLVEVHLLEPAPATSA
jgi:DNA-binding NarL/FixJ family response regulator